AKYFVEHLLHNLGLFGRSHRDALFLEQTLDHAPDFHAHAVLWDRGDAVQVQHADQLAVNLRFQLKIPVHDPRRGAAGGIPIQLRAVIATQSGLLTMLLFAFVSTTIITTSY